MRPLALTAILLALALASCGGDDDEGSDESGSTVTSTVTESTGSEPAEEEPQAEGGPAEDAAGDFEDVGPLDSFTTPSKNISCALTSKFVRCDIFEHSYEPPPKPASCEFDYGSSLSVVPGGPAEFACVSDAIAGTPDTLPVLEYGTKTTVGPFECESSSAGVRCLDTASGAGFSLAREAAETF
jgi:hypothetical protein